MNMCADMLCLLYMQQQHQQWRQPQQSGYAAPSASHSNSWMQQATQQRQQVHQQQLNSQQMAKSELQSLVHQLTPQQREHLSKMPHDKRMQFFHNLRSQMAQAQQQQQLQQQKQQMSQQGSWQQQPSGGPQQTGSGLMHQPGLASQPQVCCSHVQPCFFCPLHPIEDNALAYPAFMPFVLSSAFSALSLTASHPPALHLQLVRHMQWFMCLKSLRQL